MNRRSSDVTHPETPLLQVPAHREAFADMAQPQGASSYELGPAARGASPVPYSLMILVTYRSDALAAEQVPVLHRWLHMSDGRLVVVENSGSASLVQFVLSECTCCSWRVSAMQPTRNVGFSEGVNQGLGTATTRWGAPSSVLLMNPDVLTDAETVLAVVARAKSADLGIAAPLLVQGNDKTLDRGVARRRWNRRRLFAEVAGVPGLARALGTQPRSIDTTEAGPDGLLDVDITSGAFMVIDGTVLAKGLDTRLPMYLEDQDICRRAQQMGRRVAVVTTLSAEHLGGSSRKAATGNVTRLRMMELAEAPLMSLNDWTNGAVGAGVWVVRLGGAMRLALTLGLAPVALLRPRQRPWWSEQRSLALAFLRWRPESDHSLD